MPESSLPPRAARPRLWRSLALAGAAASLGLPAPALAYAAPISADAKLWLVAGEGGEGGEGGEAGAVEGLPSDAAYLARLAIVEGHLLAAATLYAKGQTDEAVALSYHPEAEMMEEVRAQLAAHGAADITPAMMAFSAALEAGAPQAEVDTALAAVSAAIAAAGGGEAAAGRTRLDAIVALLQAAADEYAGSIEGGQVTDPLAFHEAQAFVVIARIRAAALATEPEPKAATAAGRALDALATADEAFGDIMAADLVARDPAILLGVAARVELLASSVH